MQHHLTYLFGAGASAGVLPVDNQLTTELIAFLERCHAFVGTSEEKGYLENFINAHSWLLEDFQYQKSLDVIAKKYASNDYKLFQIKTLIWFYFSAHAGKGRLNSRYPSLLLRLSSGNNEKAPVPDNVSFLTWNYDLQLEEAYSNLKNVRLDKTPEHFYSFPGIKFLRNDYQRNRSYPSHYQFIHLNGTAGYYYPTGIKKNPFYCDYDSETQNGIDQLARFYAQELCTNRSIKDSIKDSLSFSWEDTPLVNEIKTAAVRLAEKITHLYIIGYSLPDLNKGFDYDFFTAMKNLKHITIQDLGNAERTLKILKERYPSLMNSVTVELDNTCTYFYVPEFMR